ncbi:MAG TPA: glycosyltransferase, partial [Longimicrobiaceae bacterium]|nr:glycosyltransferase [Longimicrobiaceae bacterium]
AAHLRRWEADLLPCHPPIAGIVGRLAGRMAGVPVIYTEHNRMERYNYLTRRANLLTWSWQDQVIAVSSEVAESIRAHADAGTPVKVVLNGIDTERFAPLRGGSPEVRERVGIPPAAPVIGTVAVFRAQKRLDDWLAAARLLHEKHPDARFLLVGDGPLRDDLVEKARALNLADAVHFTGLQEDVRPFLAMMDVFMVSSVFEGLPLALLEAMSMRCGVVATTVGGIPEIIRHGENGFLVEPCRPDALSRFASRMLTDAEATREMGDSARRTIETDFSLRRMTEQLEETYIQVLSDGSRGR